HPLEGFLHTARTQRTGVCEGAEEHGGDVPIHDGQAVLRAPTVGRVVLVQEALAEEVALVVLAEAGPSQERSPQHRVDRRVLEGRTREARRVPAERRERGIDVQDTEAESTGYKRGGLRFLYPTDGIIDVLRSLGEPLLRHDANPFVSARASEALEVALAYQ